MSSLKPIRLWGHDGPNPPKVLMILEELGLPYETDPIKISEVKKPEYIAVNPNGRLPAIYDPNTDLTLWESGAIVEYLIERYDTDHRLSFPAGSNDAWHAKQWLFFQTTGQGPYYGQAVWFQRYHSEKVPSALERYIKEIKRVSSVLDGWLAKRKEEEGSDWLVGDKLSYADISFVSWQVAISMILTPEQYDQKEFPHMKEWIDKVVSREKIQKALEKTLRRKK